jgi:hypothetical protein
MCHKASIYAGLRVLTLGSIPVRAAKTLDFTGFLRGVVINLIKSLITK